MAAKRTASRKRIETIPGIGNDDPISDLRQIIVNHSHALGQLQKNDERQNDELHEQYEILVSIRENQTKQLARELALAEFNDTARKKLSLWKDRATLIGLAFGILSTLTTLIQFLINKGTQ